TFFSLLHTTFQQNKDCNVISLFPLIKEFLVAHELPAKQGLQRSFILLRFAGPPQMLHTNFQQNKDCNINSIYS
ncbi:MAG: hypothetical protein PWQ46_846, partial [Methanomicrobiaceae archaeon]|nr:hypothetical protein [Methanomicrobiaceae archaeon]